MFCCYVIFLLSFALSFVHWMVGLFTLVLLGWSHVLVSNLAVGGKYSRCAWGLISPNSIVVLQESKMLPFSFATKNMTFISFLLSGCTK